jgi:hypothetical protein
VTVRDTLVVVMIDQPNEFTGSNVSSSCSVSGLNRVNGM